MTGEYYNEAIVCMTRAIVLNNAFGTAMALKKLDYPKKNYIDDCELELTLLQIFLCNKAKYFEVMNMIEWNAGETRTNNAEIKNKLIALTNMPDTSESKGNFWKALLTMMNQ